MNRKGKKKDQTSKAVPTISPGVPNAVTDGGVGPKVLPGGAVVLEPPGGAGHVYIERNNAILSGEPIIKGTRTPVRAIVELWRSGVAAEEIPTHLPHLTLAQIFDALSYFDEHQAEIISHIERNHVADNRLDSRSKIQ